MVSEMVDRFTITAAEQDPGGQWVRYSDYAAIEAQLAELAVENERLKQEIAATQEKLIRANDELIQRNSKAISRTGAVKPLDERD